MNVKNTALFLPHFKNYMTSVQLITEKLNLRLENRRTELILRIKLENCSVKCWQPSLTVCKTLNEMILLIEEHVDNKAVKYDQPRGPLRDHFEQMESILRHLNDALKIMVSEKRKGMRNDTQSAHLRPSVTTAEEFTRDLIDFVCQQVVLMDTEIAEARVLLQSENVDKNKQLVEKSPDSKIPVKVSNLKIATNEESKQFDESTETPIVSAESSLKLSESREDSVPILKGAKKRSNSKDSSSVVSLDQWLGDEDENIAKNSRNKRLRVE